METQEEIVFRCDRCDQDFPITERIEFEGEQYCAACLDAITVVCSCCGERVRRDENFGNDATPLCESCYDRHYTTCTRCGRLIRYDDACYDSDDPDEEEPYCSACYRERHQHGIQDYYYKPEPIFYGSGSRFFGVELEIDGAGEYNENAKRILDAVNTGDEYIYCKHDGSLDEGFEIVTHPMTPQFHLDTMPWDVITEEAREMGYTSHQAGTCGLHIHVNRTAFGNTEQKQDAAIARVLYFFEKHWEELLKFSRRTQHQLDRWAARYGFKEQPQDILTHAKEGRHAGRYTAVNLTNVETVEFRMFRGTLKLNTILATLQLIDRICDVALSLSDDELKSMSWTSFVSGCTQPELVRYLKERQLYINEPVESEVEL